MNHLFVEDYLSIHVQRTLNDELVISVSSDYSQSERKSSLYVNPDYVSKLVETAWKSIKTKKLKRIQLYFSEIDWYDDMTNIYYTPVVTMRRGARKCNVSSKDHGSIPKDWQVNVRALMADTKTTTPITEVLKVVLGKMFTPNVEKDFISKLRPVLRKESRECSYYNK
jgi:hypothetical protein